MLAILYTCVLILVVWFTYRLLSRAFDKLANSVPSNRWHSLLGFGHILTSKNILNIISDYGKKYGPNSIFWIGPYPLYLTTDPVTIKEVLSSKNCIDKPLQLYNGVHSVGGAGLLSESDPAWTRHRKLLHKAFTNKNMISFLPTFNAEIDKFMNELDICVEKAEDLDMLLKLRVLTMKNATRTTLKRDMDVTKYNATSMSKYFEHILQLAAFYTLNPLLVKNWFRTHVEPHFFKKATEGLNVFYKFIEESINIARKNDSTDQSFLANGYGVLDCCINVAEQKDLDKDEMHGLLMQFYVAAFETISTTLYFALSLLAMHPEYQDRAYDEVQDILNAGETELTAAQLDDLTYLDMVFNETMRILPTIPLVSRKVSNENLTLSKNITLPIGQIIGINIFQLHRSPELWGPEAESFNPDNFLPANVAARHPYAFIPFTKGQRFCIGMRYANILFKMSMAKLIKSYKFSTDFQYKDLRFEHHITLKLVEEPRLKLERRQKN